jgi:DNA-directed RNA polymerase specialized sigma24 family protein
MRPAALPDFACVSAAWQAHEGELLGHLQHRLSDADAADDVLQDVFVKALRHGQGFRMLDNPRAWLFQVARNALVDQVRTAHPMKPQRHPKNPLRRSTRWPVVLFALSASFPKTTRPFCRRAT